MTLTFHHLIFLSKVTCRVIIVFNSHSLDPLELNLDLSIRRSTIEMSSSISRQIEPGADEKE